MLVSPMLVASAAEAVKESVHLTDVLIVVSNLLLFLVTAVLIRVTTKDAAKSARQAHTEMAQVAKMESRNTRLLARILRSNIDAKHRSED